MARGKPVIASTFCDETEQGCSDARTCRPENAVDDKNCSIVEDGCCFMSASHKFDKDAFLIIDLGEESLVNSFKIVIPDPARYLNTRWNKSECK